MNYGMNRADLLYHLDYSSLECVVSILKRYFDIEDIALSGDPSVLDLYLEFKIALDKLPEIERVHLLESILTDDESGIETGSKQVQSILLVGSQ